MLPINVSTADIGFDFSLITALLLCCALPMIMRSQRAPQETSESDSWYVDTNIQETYDAIVKITDDWREKAKAKKSKGISSVFSRKPPEFFTIDQAVPPRLYGVEDKEQGKISFELTEVEGGGTAIRSTYSLKARMLIQNFKATLPMTIPKKGPKICVSCGKELMPEFQTCPYCGSKVT